MQALFSARHALDSGQLAHAERYARTALESSVGDERLLACAVLAQVDANRGGVRAIDELRQLADEEGSLYAQMVLARWLLPKRLLDEAERRLDVVMRAGGSPSATITAALLSSARKKPNTSGLSALMGSAPYLPRGSLNAIMLVALHARDRELLRSAYERRQRLLGGVVRPFAEWTMWHFRQVNLASVTLMVLGGVTRRAPLLAGGTLMGLGWLVPVVWHFWRSGKQAFRFSLVVAGTVAASVLLWLAPRA